MQTRLAIKIFLVKYKYFLPNFNIAAAEQRRR